MDSTPQTLDLTPEIINLDVQQGTDVTITFQLTDNAGAPVDITDDTVEVTAKDGYGGTVMIATKSNGPGDHQTPASGTSTFVFTKTDLTTEEPDSQVSWVYEVRRVFATSLREVIYIHGALTLFPSVGTSI